MAKTFIFCSFLINDVSNEDEKVDTIGLVLKNLKNSYNHGKISTDNFILQLNSAYNPSYLKN